MEQTAQYLKNFSDWRTERAKAILEHSKPESIDLVLADNYSHFGYIPFSYKDIYALNVRGVNIFYKLNSELNDKLSKEKDLSLEKVKKIVLQFKKIIRPLLNYIKNNNYLI